MLNRTRTAISVCFVAVVALIAFASWQAGWDLTEFEAYVQRHSVAGAIAFIAVFAGSTVLPISALPLLPLAARAYGVWVTVLLTTAGWWIGCLAAFAIARSGRDWLERVTSLQAIERFEQRMPARVGFGGILMLRIIFPGDIAGFALGLLKHVRFSTYAAASLLGTIPSALLCSFAGAELGRGHIVSTALLVLALVVGTLLLKKLWRPEPQEVRTVSTSR
ncbi:MAG TPA: VTT domain-containing protein [Burkholderiales bacterium]|nr:VTT domain-containing protein [Burkholderiales bacterium]